METVLVDTSFLIGLLCERDVHHNAAKNLYIKLKDKYKLLFTDVVLAESITVLERRFKEWNFSFKEVANSLRRLVPNPAQFSYYFLTKFWTIWDLMLESQGRLTFNDALLVVGCREEGIEKIATFDKGFQGYLELTKL